MPAKNQSAAADAEQARKRNQAAAWDAYFGRFKKPLRANRGTDDNIIVNRCRPIVNKGVSFLFGKAVDFQIPAGTQKGKSAQKFLDATWSANRKQSTLQKWALSGGVNGSAFMRIMPTQPYPTLKVLDGATVTLTTAPDDVDQITSYSICYPTEDDAGNKTQHRQLITPSSDGKSWLIVEQEQDQKGNFNQVGAPVEWPYPFAPIVHNQNLVAPGQVWGLADLEADLIQINDDLNFILSNIARIIRLYAHPKTVGKGFNGDALRVAADGTIILPSPESSLDVLEMKSDLSSSLNVAAELRSAMDELSHVPSIALGTIKDIPKGTVSGIALQILYQPLLEKTAVKRCTYGDALVELCSRLLVIGGYAAADVLLKWATVEPTDITVQMTAAKGMESLGFSKTTIFDMLGYDYAAELENVAAEKQDEPEQPPVVVAAADSNQQPEQLQPGQTAPTNVPAQPTTAKAGLGAAKAA